MNTKINEVERKVLEVLVPIWDSELNCYYMKYIAEDIKEDVKRVRRALRSLARKGLTQYVRGLIDDDGMVAGSGYCATKAGAVLIDPCKLCGKEPSIFTTGECNSCYKSTPLINHLE